MVSKPYASKGEYTTTGSGKGHGTEGSGKDHEHNLLLSIPPYALKGVFEHTAVCLKKGSCTDGLFMGTSRCFCDGSMVWQSSVQLH